jgi:zinc transport system substrate-binding protein
MHRRFSWAAAAFLPLILIACGTPERQESVAHSEVPQIFAVNYPIAYFAEVLAADNAVISFPAPAEVDPAYWQPDLDIILAYQRADLILLNGAGYAGWVRQVSLPQRRLVDTSTTYKDDLLAVASESAHSHGPEGAHDHGKLAFTTWLDLDLAQQQVSAIAQALLKLMPQNSSGIDERAVFLKRELTDLDQSLVRITSHLRGVPIVFSHPVYQYFERRYQLSGRSVHWEPSEMPTEAQWQAFKAMLNDHPARIMLWEDEPLASIRDRLAAMGLSVVVYRPLGNRSVEGDFLEVTHANVDALAAVASP